MLNDGIVEWENKFIGIVFIKDVFSDFYIGKIYVVDI